MKTNLLILFSIFACYLGAAQNISSNDIAQLRRKEDSLKVFASQIVQGRSDEVRFNADSQFTKTFVRALKIHNAFYYPFDSLVSISKLAPGDSSFKIFTWQLVINDEVTRQHGAIQMRTSDGSLKLFPLVDKSDVIKNIADTVANNFGWVGAVYYKLIQKKAFDKNYYTLLGYDENNIRSTKKIIDVLTFNNTGEPIFGGPYFSFPNGSLTNSFGNRFIMEYKKDAGPHLNYDEEQDMIILEHLIPEPGIGDVKKKYTYVGDGDYDALQWKNGKWVHIDKVFTFKLKEGEEPIPAPIRDAQGNVDPSKIKDNGDEDQLEEPIPDKPKVITKPSSPVKSKTKIKK